jgi:hypothetical protein
MQSNAMQLDTTIIIIIIAIISVINGARGSVVSKALCYKLEGRGFETRFFKFT